MRVTALLSWYDENPAWLAECVAALSKVSDHVIAVDGAYSHFPGALRQPASSAEQVDAIVHTAAGVGIGCTIHQPRQTWWGEKWGGEVAKRDWMMKAAMLIAEPGDWLFRVDADEFVTEAPYNFRQTLEDTDKNVAEVMLWERDSDLPGGEHPLRCLFRAIPGIRIEQAHFMVTAPVNGVRKTLVGPGCEPVEPIWDLRLEHRTRLRPAARMELKTQYSALINTFEKVEGKPRGENYERS